MPLAVLVLVFTPALLQVFASVDLDTGLTWFVTSLIAIYSLGAHGEFRRSLVGLAFAIGITFVVITDRKEGWG